MDSTGYTWCKFDDKYCRQPRYAIPGNILQLMNQRLQLVETYTRLIELPYVSVPMWLKNPDAIHDVMQYRYCICMRCGLLCRHLVRVAILLVFSRDTHGVLSCSFWCCVVCNECADVRHLTYFPNIIRATSIVVPILSDAWNSFIADVAVSSAVCVVCFNPNTACCDDCNEVAAEMRHYGVDPSAPTSLEDISISYMLFLFKHKVDVVKEMVPLVCYNPTCQIQCISVYFSCQHCHSVLFCSKKCMDAAHGNVECHWFLQHWL
jgi:hypothetical protein